MQRGFSSEILKKYDIGDYTDKRGKLGGRAVVPVYDDTREFVIGVTGRTLYNSECKWLHTDNFPACYSLFNWWFCQDFIKKTKEVILVEGPMDCIKLEMAGIRNSVALFGGNFSTAKQLKIDSLGVTNLIIGMDSDLAGQNHAKKIIAECAKFYNIKNLILPEGKDFGDMSIGEINEFFQFNI